MAEAAFSEDGKYYSAISSDGRLKIWDTETSILKQEYTPDLHLTAPPSCLQWITAAQSIGQSQKQGKKRASINETETQYIALGTANGKILLYSVAQAKIQVILQKGANKVNALDWHRKYGLYSCAKETIVEWELQSGSVKDTYNIGLTNSNNKQGNVVSAIKIVPHKLNSNAQYIVTASWHVRLWRLHNGEATVIKTLGHNSSQTAVLSIATLNSNCWLIEGSQNERLLSFWDVTITDENLPQVNGGESPNKKKRKKSISDVPTIINASYKFVLEDAPRIVDVELRKEDETIKLSLAAATRSGVVHYYGHTLNGSSIKPLKPSVTLQVTTPEAAPLALLCCRLRESDKLLVGYNQPPSIVFESVVPDLKTKTQVLIRGETKTPKKIKQTNETNKVWTDFKSSEAQVVEPMGGVTMRKRTAPGAQVEVPMEARLANLSLDIKGRSQTAVNENLTKLLVQGLHSKDTSIIRMVLLNNKPAVAQRTVSNLPAEYVPLLLEQLLELATKRTDMCLSVCTWVEALMTTHSALLLALMSSHHSHLLTSLLAVFTHRRSHLCQLMNLKGRVDLTIKQRTKTDNGQENRKAMLEYNDDSSSEEEMQVEKYKSDSEQSWGDDKFDSNQGEDSNDDEDDEKMDHEDGDNDKSSSSGDED